MSTPTMLTEVELSHALAIRDLTAPEQGTHAIQLVVADVVEALTAGDGPHVDVRASHPVVTLADNYDNLGYAADAVTRDARYTRYVDQGHVLRSHTSAQIPGALREFARSAAHDRLTVSAGICYRRDSIDWQHTGSPHQLDLWRISRGREPLDEDALMAMIGTVVDAALPGASWRTMPSPHPYTDAGREIEVRWRDEWIEVGECGLAAAHVLRRAGLGERWSGLAVGLGLDRMLMLRKGIPDIRLLRSEDSRVATQMIDLTPYRPVSSRPPVRRDLSVVVGAGADLSDELLGDRVRTALSDDADSVETVAVVSETSYDELPAAARARIGMHPGQRNVLVRLVLRPVDRTLTDHEANVLRDRVYAELHEGSTAQWAAR